MGTLVLIDLDSQMTLSDLNQEEILLVEEAVEDCLKITVLDIKIK